MRFYFIFILILVFKVILVTAQQKTAILVKTEPGVKLFLNDSLVGKIENNQKDLIIKGVLPGKQKLLLVKKGTLPQYYDIYVTAGEVSVVNAKPFIKDAEKQKHNKPSATEISSKPEPLDSNRAKIFLFSEVAIKLGSQNPKFGVQMGIILTKPISEILLSGIGSGYRSNLGTGDYSVPLFADLRYHIARKNIIINSQIGTNFNKSSYYKNSYFAAVGINYKIWKTINNLYPSLRVGINLEFNHTPFYESFNDIILHNGYLQQLMLGGKVSFPIHFNTKRK